MLSKAHWKEIIFYSYIWSYDYISLRRVTFEAGSHLKVIGEKTFHNCVVDEIKIPANVEYIGTDCFINCWISRVKFAPGFHILSGFGMIGSLEEIEIPACVDVIDVIC